MHHFSLQKYIDLAEQDKKRYIDELTEYQQSEQYLNFINRKRLKIREGKENWLLYCLLIVASILEGAICPGNLTLSSTGPVGSIRIFGFRVYYERPMVIDSLNLKLR